MIGLEPTHLAIPDPKSGASTNFATRAYEVQSYTLFFNHQISLAKYCRRARDYGQWTTDNGQQTTDNGQQATDNGQQTMDNRQWRMENEQWTMDNGQQTTDNRQRTTDNGQQTMGTIFHFVVHRCVTWIFFGKSGGRVELFS